MPRQRSLGVAAPSPLARAASQPLRAARALAARAMATRDEGASTTHSEPQDALADASDGAPGGGAH